MSFKTIGRIVGALTLLAYVVYMAGGELVGADSGSPAALADVADNQRQMALGALLMLLNSVAVISIGVLVFPVLKRRHEITAYAYLAARVVEGVMLAVGVLCLLLLIPLAQAQVDPGSSSAPLAGAVQAANQYALHIGMIGLGIGGALFCRALIQDRLVPKPLAVLGMVGYPVLAAGEALEVLGYDLNMLHYAAGGIFEVAFGVLLLIKGFPTQQDRQDPVTTATDPHRAALETP